VISEDRLSDQVTRVLRNGRTRMS